MIRDENYSFNPFKTSFTKKRSIVTKVINDQASSSPKVKRAALKIKANRDDDRYVRQVGIRKKSSGNEKGIPKLNLKGNPYKGNYPKTAALRLEVKSRKNLKIAQPTTAKEMEDSRKDARRNRAKKFLSK